VDIHNPNKKSNLCIYQVFNWGKFLESVSITTDGNAYSFNVPKNLKQFSITSNDPNDNPWGIFDNVEDLFTAKMERLELIEYAVSESVLKVLAANCPNLEVTLILYISR
jgi:hypothetical protein